MDLRVRRVVLPGSLPGIYPARRRRNDITGNWHVIPIRRVSHVVDYPFKWSLQQLAIVSHRVLRTMRMSGLLDRADGSSPLPTTYRHNLPTTVLPPLCTVVKRPYDRIRSFGGDRGTVTPSNRSLRTGLTVERACARRVIAASLNALAVSVAPTITCASIYRHQHLKLRQLQLFV